jgi:hypothetical protein
MAANPVGKGENDETPSTLALGFPVNPWAASARSAGKNSPRRTLFVTTLFGPLFVTVVPAVTYKFGVRLGGPRETNSPRTFEVAVYSQREVAVTKGRPAGAERAVRLVDRANRSALDWTAPQVQAGSTLAVGTAV